jgi:hypothetical protein
VTPKSLQTDVAAVSLVLGPLIAAVGDLIQPNEDADSAEQAAIVIDHASRWYAAHLLLLIGILLFIPGVLAITSLAMSRRPRVGYTGRVLILIGLATFVAIFVSEMVLGQYANDGADEAAVTALLDTFQSGSIIGALIPFALAFFVGTGLTVFVLAAEPGPLRWPAVLLAVGAILILVEIISVIVLFSQAGNVLLAVSGLGFAWALIRGDHAVV